MGWGWVCRWSALRAPLSRVVPFCAETETPWVHYRRTDAGLDVDVMSVSAGICPHVQYGCIVFKAEGADISSLFMPAEVL